MRLMEARALVADDDATTRFLARAVLESLGLAVVEAADGREAVARFRERACDLVLLDGLMPGLDGFAACAELRRLPGGDRALVLMLSGLEDPDLLERAGAAGVNDFLPKPVDYLALGRRLRLLLRHQTAAAAAAPALPAEPAELLARLEGMLAQARRHGRRLAVLAVRPVPERLMSLLGRDGIRELWSRLRERLRSQLRSEDGLDLCEGGPEGAATAVGTLAEAGAALVLLGDLRAPDDALRVAERLCRAFETPLDLDGGAFLADLRVGIAHFPGDGDRAGGLVDRALAALALALEGGTRCRCYDAGRDALARERLVLAAELQGAIGRGELQLDCRPVRAPGGRLLGARLLPRVDHPRLGPLSLPQLRDLSGGHDLLRSVELQALERAAELVDAWRGQAPPRLTVPVSAALLLGPELPAALRRISADLALPLDWLELECLDPLPTGAEPVADLLRRLKALGPSLALALSGPGLAALGSPDPLPADRLCAVAPPPQAGAAAAERLRLLADLAHSLGAALRVEGADDQVRLEILEGTGCDEATGEAVGPPLPAWSFLTDVWTVADREATCAHRGALLC